MSDSRELLLEHASESLSASEPNGDELDELGERGRELTELLQERNGFFAFASALHVFPLGDATVGRDLLTWNSEELWRHEYGDLAEGHFFFAEDLYGNQFSLFEGKVVFFEAETGEAKPLADDVPGWLDRIVADNRFLTAWPTAVEWQEANEPLPPGTRLAPKKPFVIGGEYDVANLRVMDAVEAMQFRGYLAQQLRDVPEGTEVRLTLGPPDP